MRKQIEIELVRDAQNRVSSFNVYYSARDPHVAQQVTSELTNLFISENLEVRQQQSEGTTKFLESQLESARKTLSDQEEKIREFKGQHVGELPAQVGSNCRFWPAFNRSCKMMKMHLIRPNNNARTWKHW